MSRWLLVPALGAPLALASCTSLLGDFTVGGDGGSSGDGGGNSDVVSHPEGGAEAGDSARPMDGTVDGRMDSGVGDSSIGDSSVGDTGVDSAGMDGPVDTGVDTGVDSGCPTGEKTCANMCTPEDTTNGCGDLTTCAACGPYTNAQAICNAANVCSFACIAPFANCANSTTGCNTNTSTDVMNCSMCGTVCSVANATTDCTNGMCGIAACFSGYADCNGAYSDGCEINITSDPSHCGTCTNACSPTEVCVNASCQCPAGTSLCGGSCINTQSDPNNCGTCNHNCLGGMCANGACQPVLLTGFNGAGYGITLDGNNVYFTNGQAGGAGSLYSCAKTGCPGGPIVLGTLPTFGIAAAAFWDSVSGYVLMTDNNNGLLNAYFTTGGMAWSSSGHSAPVGIAADANNIYVGTGSGIDKVSHAGASNGGLCAGFPSNALSLAVDSADTAVFAAVGSNPGNLEKCPVAGGSNSFGTPPNAERVALVGTTLFYTVAGTAPSYADGGLFATTTNFTAPLTYATGVSYGFAVGLTADTSYVYFASYNNAVVYRCPFTGCGGNIVTVATGQGVRAMTNDATAVYWVNDSGQVYKLAK